MARNARAKRKTYRLSAVFWKEGEQVVGKCAELGVSSFGASLEEARERLQEAAGLYLENAKALGLIAGFEATLATGERYSTTIEVSA
jgi:predicted RNase H-like HicB family nuclease